MLSEIGRRHGTDKADAAHCAFGYSYLDVYETYFTSRRDEPLRLLEIGVRQGASLRTWAEYFPNAAVWGLDIDPACARHGGGDGGRVHVAIGSQDDEALLRSLCDRAGGFDIVIDDGSHINELTLASFATLFPRLNRGGTYIIEDLWNSYYDMARDVEHWGGGFRFNRPDLSLRNDLSRGRLDETFLALIRSMDHVAGEVCGVHFWPRIAVITKWP